MVTDRGLRSTVSPALASLYSSCPSCLSAEYIGGTCSISPVKRGSTASTAARETRQGRIPSTSPSATPVLVVMPRRASVTQVLCASLTHCEYLMASPRPSDRRAGRDCRCAHPCWH